MLRFDVLIGRHIHTARSSGSWLASSLSETSDENYEALKRKYSTP